MIDKTCCDLKYVSRAIGIDSGIDSGSGIAVTAVPIHCIPITDVVVGLSMSSSSLWIIDGALVARPPSYLNPNVFMCLFMMTLSTCLVNMSDGLSAPGILVNLKSFLRRRSWIHRSAVAKCLTFPRPRRLAIPIAAVASVMIVSCNLMPRSAARDCKPSDWAAPLHIPVNSASAELSATVV